MSASRTWAPPEATSSSEIIRTYVGWGHWGTRYSPRGPGPLSQMLGQRELLLPEVGKGLSFSTDRDHK